MGMAASQARLLSITARMSNNEHAGQTVSYAKQRLADQTQQITNEYNEALNATKLTVLTGFNGAQANYEDISYNLMTGLQMAESTKQYVVTDTKGKVLVTNEIAKAYEKSHGNINRFLADLGYSIADINVQKTYADVENRTPSQVATEQQIHEAWDKYFQTIYLDYVSPNAEEMHDFGFSWTETYDNPQTENYSIGDGFAGYARTDGNGNYVDNEGKLTTEPSKYVYDPINYEGTTQESRDLYDYAMAITEAYLRVNGNTTNGQDFKVEYDLNSMKSANNLDNNSALKYYKNIFNKIQSSGYFTYTNTPAEIDENHVYTSEGTGTKGNVQKNPLKDNYTFEAALRDGSLRLEYYSSTKKSFQATTISEDNCIQEVIDERAIARAESKYNQDMADLENKDKKFDLDLKRLDTEHNALQTEYDSVKNVVDKNVESSFKIFS